MKNSLLFYSLICIGFLIVNPALSQTTHTITLNVNTAEISKSNLSSTCNFGQAANISNEDFNLNVSIEDSIVWNIIATDRDPRDVNLINVKFEKGRNLLQSSQVNDKKGKVRAKITKGAKGQFEKYSIRFRVKGRGVFVIDPKLTIKN